MHLELISFLSTDNLELPGLLYSPSQPTKKVLVWLHGMGDAGIFYSQARIHAMAETLGQRGIAFFPFNNRGAHNYKTLRKVSDNPADEDGRYQAGTLYEKIVDCIPDIHGAVSFLKKQGFQEFYLGGHSTGANKVCVYDARATDNPFSRYVLAGPGDDSGLFYNELGDKTFRGALSYATQVVIHGQPTKTMPLYTGMHPFSAQSAADILDPNGDYNTFPLFETTTKRLGKKTLFKEYRHIKKPMLVIYGENDEYAYTGGGTYAALKIFQQFTHPDALPASAFTIVPETDHGFHDQEHRFAKAITDWLDQ